jgi:excisionase family DNA binding protein
MDKLLTISEAAALKGVSASTLRRWERDGRLVPERTAGGQRRYRLSQIEGRPITPATRTGRTVAYARVSSNDQKEDLARQARVLELHCAAHGWAFELIQDLGSGMNYQKRGLRKLLDDVIAGRVDRLVITHKDRLLRFGAELVFAICETRNVEVVILNKGKDSTFEEDLAKDVLEIITVFSARLYGARSRKNQRLIESVAKAVEDASRS